MTRHHPLPHPRHPAAPGAPRRAGRVIVGLAAAILLLALLAGVPYGLARGVGWPLPHHLPTVAEVKATLSGPFTDRILIDTLACLCWLVWAIFAADTIHALPDAIHATRGSATLPRSQTVDRADGRRFGPLRGLPAVLLAAIVTGLLSLRLHPVAPASSVDAPTVVTSMQPTAVSTSVHIVESQDFADRFVSRDIADT